MLNTPKSGRATHKPKYDSDDHSSMMSEPGSPQDISMSSDEDMDEDLLSHSPDGPFGGKLPSSPWQARMQANRVPTPILPSPRATGRPPHLRTHVRSRHPQEINSSSFADHLEVPSPIDEDEVPTPPSAAEAAGSQLSMLSVNDMDLEPRSDVPTISIDPSQTLPFNEHVERSRESEYAVEDFGRMDSNSMLDAGHIVRKQRARSGALSNGGGSPAPGSGEPSNRRGFHMGFRADCEKCRMRIPGHMNHFLD